jgi:hypothetical protein
MRCTHREMRCTHREMRCTHREMRCFAAVQAARYRAARRAAMRSPHCEIRLGKHVTRSRCAMGSNVADAPWRAAVVAATLQN